MAVHYALVKNIIVDCGIADINPCQDEGKKESPKTRFIPDQEYRLISMDDTHIVEDQSNDGYQSKCVCAKGVGGRSTNKYEKVAKGGMLFSAAGSN